MNVKTKIALACGLSASLVAVGSLTPIITYAVQNAKNEPETEDKYEYTEADLLDTKTNLLVNYDRYPQKSDDVDGQKLDVLKKIEEIVSDTTVSYGARVYLLLQLGRTVGINLVDWPLVLYELKNRELSVASQIANKEEFKELNDLYNSLHKEYVVFEILDRESTALSDKILASHDEPSTPEIAKLRARNLLKYEIESAKKTHDQLKGVAGFALNKQTSLNNYYYQNNNRDSFITIDQLNDQGELFIGSDITAFLPNLAVNKNEIKDTFNLIQNTSYALNDTQFTLYARIESFDYEKSEGDFDITIDYGMIETNYDALPNRNEFMVWYSDFKEDQPENQQMLIFGDEEENKNPLKYHMLLSNEVIDDWAREWFADPEHQISFIQDNDHGFDTVRKIVEQKGGLSHHFTMEEMSEFITLPNGVKIDNTSLPGVNLNMVISSMDATTNKIEYKLFLTFDFAPDVTTQSKKYQVNVAASKKIVEDLFKTYNNIVDTVAVYKDWAYQRNIGWPFEKITGQKILNYAMNILTLCTVGLIISACLYIGMTYFETINRPWPWQWKAILIGVILLAASALSAGAVTILVDLFNFSKVFVCNGKFYSRSDYWNNIDDILTKMKDDHEDNINNFVDNMSSTIIENKDKMEKIRNNPNPTMAEIDEMVGIFGNYEKPINNDSKTWTLGQKSYAVNNWMMDLMKSDTSKYDWMIHAKYGVDNPTHDVNKEVSCAIVANQQALASESMFKLIPWLIVGEFSTFVLGTTSVVAGIGCELMQYLKVQEASDMAFFGELLTNWVFKGLAFLIATITGNLGLGFISTVFIDIFKVFDYKNMKNNFDTLCDKHSSYKLFPKAAISIAGVCLWTLSIVFASDFIWKYGRYFIFLMFATACIYLQIATYFAMFSNFK